MGVFACLFKISPGIRREVKAHSHPPMASDIRGRRSSRGYSPERDKPAHEPACDRPSYQPPQPLREGSEKFDATSLQALGPIDVSSQLRCGDSGSGLTKTQGVKIMASSP